MGLFDFFKGKKDVLTDNGLNYLYYSNGNLKEKFTKINGVLHGDYFKYDESGKIQTTIYHYGKIISSEKKLKINNLTKENSLNEFKKNTFKLLEIDNLISKVADGNLIIQMTNNTLIKFSEKINNVFLNYFENEFLKFYIFYKRNYLLNNFFFMENDGVNLNLFFTEHLNKRIADIEKEISEISIYASRSRITYAHPASYYISHRVSEKLMVVNKNKYLIKFLSEDVFDTIYEQTNITNQNCKLIGLKVDGYYSIYEVMNSIRVELKKNFSTEILWFQYDDNSIKQTKNIENKIYENILSICNTYQCNQDEIEFALGNLNIGNLLKSSEANNLSAIDLFNKGIEKIEFKDYLGAIADFTKAIVMDKNYIDAYIKRADSKAEIKDYNGALEDYDITIQLDVDSKVYYKRGKIKKELLDFNGALEDYNFAIEKYPADESIFLRRGELKCEMEDYVGAIDDISKCIELKPNIASYFCIIRGNFKLKNNDYFGAIEDYSFAIQDRLARFGTNGKLTENAEKSLAEIYHKRGVARNKIKEYSEAINDFENAIKLNPSCENDVKVDLEIANKQN